jgi:excisionase family DNA binding protein
MRMIKRPKAKTHLTPNEVAEMLMVNPVTVRQWASRGLLRALTTPGGHRRYLLEDVENFARSRRTTVARGSQRPSRVLIVDDDPNLSMFLMELIRERDPSVSIETAADGFEAGLKVESFRPHALLLDLMMPGMDGFEVCRQVRARPALNTVRIVAMTGYPSPENLQQIMAAGANVLLSKPLDTGRLLFELGLAVQEVSGELQST